MAGRWVGYNEASCLYLLGLGAKTNALRPTFWERWTKDINGPKYHDYNFVTRAIAVYHQYFSGLDRLSRIADSYMREKQSDYSRTSRQATLAANVIMLLSIAGYPNYSTNGMGLHRL